MSTAVTIWCAAFFLILTNIAFNIGKIARYIKEGRCK